MLNFLHLGKQVVQALLYTWNRSCWLLKEIWRQRRQRIIHFTISAPGGFGRNSVRYRNFGWSILLETLIRDLAYRRRHGCEPRDIYWSPIAKCESPAPTWVANRIIHHPCYSWYAAQILCQARVDFILTLIYDIASDLAQNPVRFSLESFVGHEEV